MSCTLPLVLLCLLCILVPPIGPPLAIWVSNRLTCRRLAWIDLGIVALCVVLGTLFAGIASWTISGLSGFFFGALYFLALALALYVVWLQQEGPGSDALRAKFDPSRFEAKPPPGRQPRRSAVIPTHSERLP